MKSNHVRSKVLLLSALSLAVAESVYAAQLEEVIVTAQKRVESLQDVPISITAVSGERMYAAGITNMEDLSSFVPGLTVSKNAVNTNIYMRGLGSGNNRGFEQSVGMYIDGIYMGRGRQYRAPFLDVERVEVLRGPQGILFGKNTIAGAVNITTAKPNVGDDFNGELRLEYEPEYDTTIATGILSGPIGDNFAARLAVRWHESDGYIENTFLNEDSPAIEETVIRLSAVWEATDNLSINVKYEEAEFDTVGNNAVVKTFKLLDNPSGPLGTPAYLMSLATDPSLVNSKVGYKASIANSNLRSPTYNQDTGQKNDITNFALNVEWRLDNHTLSSVTGYSGYEAEDQADVDFLPIDFIPRYDDRQYDQWSQELRLASDTGGKFDYIVGAYAQRSELDLAGHVSVNIDGATGVGLPVDLDEDGITDAVLPWHFARVGSFEQDQDSWAIFAQGTWHFTDTLRLTAGLRYGEETKEVDRELYISTFDDISTPLGLGDGPIHQVPLSSTGGAVIAPVPAGALAHQVWGVSLNTFAHGGPAFELERNEDLTTPMANLQWDATDELMLYATASMGFKGGGFNGSDNAAVPDGEGNIVPFQLEYDKEEATSFEIGGKSRLLDGAAELNFALFYTQFDDLQVSTFDGLSFKVGNAASATTQGFELDGRWAATESLTLGGNLAYLDATFDDFETGSCTAVQVRDSALANTAKCEQDLSGKPTNYAPEWAGTLFAEWYQEVGAGMAIRIGADLQYSDWYYTEGDNDPESVQDSYTKLNARIALSDVDNRWEIALMGRNLTDEETFNGTLDVPLVEGSHTAFMEPPRTISVQAKYSF